MRIFPLWHIDSYEEDELQMFQQVFEQVQLVTIDRLMHVLAGSGNTLWERQMPQMV